VKKILLISYSQTGQLDRICESIFSRTGAELQVEPCKIVQKKKYPYPIDSDTFFDAMPDCVTGKTYPCHLEPVSKSDDYDLIVLAYSAWFLKPSVPTQSFLATQQAASLLEGKKVLTIMGVRNMWYNAQEDMKKHLRSKGAKLIGNIVLVDRNPNLISVITIVHWLMGGKKDRLWGLFPEPGVAAGDIQKAAEFGPIIAQHMEDGQLQDKLREAGAVKANPLLFFIDNTATRIFKLWAAIIVKKGKTEKDRRFWVRAYKYYLFVAIFTIMPIISFLHFLISPIFAAEIRKKRLYFEGVSQND
jgi:hypothetical protein